MQHLDHLEKCYKHYVKEYLVYDTRFRSNMIYLGEYQKKFWNEIVTHCETQFQCERCPTARILPKDFESHYENVHPDVNVKKSCVFCDGRYQGKDANHLTKCFKLKEEQQQQLELAFPLTMDLTPQCPARDMFGRELFVPGYYEDLFLLPEEEEEDVLRFRDNVDMACRYVSSWGKKRKQFWYHVMVRYVTMKKFCEIMAANRSTTWLLRHWCWCDGGDPEQEAGVRHHRHMILVTTDPKFMKREWKKVFVGASNNFQCKKAFRLKTVWHLRNTINYVSKRESRCQFSFDDDAGGLHHYCIGASLPKIGKLCMATCTENGVSEYLVERFGKVSSWTLLENNAVMNREGKWQVCAAALFRADEMGCVLPVERNWRPCDSDSSSPYFIWLMNGKKMYFEKSAVEVEKEDQAAGGNVLYKIFDDMWTLPPSKQQELHLVYLMKERMSNLRVENNRLREDGEADRARMEKQMCDLQAECMKWKRDGRNAISKLSKYENKLELTEKELSFYKGLEMQYCQYREELGRKEAMWKLELESQRQEMSRLHREEMNSLRQEMSQKEAMWKMEMETLRQEITRLHREEMKTLRQEMSRKDEELKTLRAEMTRKDDLHREEMTRKDELHREEMIRKDELHREEMAAAKKEIDSLRQELKLLNADELNRLREELKLAKNEIQSLREELKLTKDENQSLREELKLANNEIQSLRETVARQAKTIKSLKEELKRMREEHCTCCKKRKLF